MNLIVNKDILLTKEGEIMKRFKICFLFLMAFIMPAIVKASINDIPELKTEEELINCFTTGGYCKLGADLKLGSELSIDKTAVLDLNGHTLMPADDLKKQGGFIQVERGANLTIKDSVGSGKISTGAADNSNVWGAIQLIYANKDSDKLAELTVDSGTIEGYYYGIVGNGKNHNSKVTINGGTIKGLNEEDSVGIYQPQIGTLTVNGGTIKGGTGIEIRSGTLTVNKGTIEGTAPKFVKMKNTNGSTTNGVGVAVAQHTTKNAIDVTINGGNISGQYAFYEWNPHSNSRTDLDKISIKITGGTFTGTADGVSTVYSEDFTDFISGGTFNKSVAEYLTEDATVTSKLMDNEIALEKKSSKGSTVAVVISLIVIVTAMIGAYLYFNKTKNFPKFS